MPRDADGRKIPTETEKRALEMIDKGMTGTEALDQLSNLLSELDTKKRALIMVARYRLKRREISERLSEWIDGYGERIKKAADNGRPVILSLNQAETLYNALVKAENIQEKDG